MRSKDEFSRDEAAIRCARDTMLLDSLASSRDTAGEMEGEKRREIEDLRRRRLSTKKKIRDRIKLCGLMERLLLLILVLLLSSFFLVFFLGSA